jgi:hypothetical protein
MDKADKRKTQLSRDRALGKAIYVMYSVENIYENKQIRELWEKMGAQARKLIAEGM